MKFLPRALPVLVIIGVVIYLIATSFTEALTYYVTAKEFQSNASRYQGKTIKIAGWVRAGSIVKDPQDPLHLTFIVRENEIEIPVDYKGIAPDTFKDDAEVVVTGQWNGQVFESKEILAKCASKYSEKLAEDAR